MDVIVKVSQLQVDYLECIQIGADKGKIIAGMKKLKAGLDHSHKSIKDVDKWDVDKFMFKDNAQGWVGAWRPFTLEAMLQLLCTSISLCILEYHLQYHAVVCTYSILEDHLVGITVSLSLSCLHFIMVTSSHLSQIDYHYQFSHLSQALSHVFRCSLRSHLGY